jgi:hypothetical protein
MGAKSSVKRARSTVERVVRLHPAEVPATLVGAVKRKVRGPEAVRYVHLPEVDDPFDAISKAGGAVPVIEVELARLRPYAISLPVTDGERNPFTRCVAEHVAGVATDYGSSALWRFYDRWQPASIGEVFGAGSTAKADGLPVMPDCLPWHEGCTPDSIRRGRQIHDRRMAEQFGAGAAHGYRSFGPVSQVAGERFYADYTEVADSVQAIGYRPEMGEQPMLELLADGDRWVGRVLAGNHRAAVRAGLGHETIGMAVRPRVVRRSDVKRWPGVRWGLYTVDQACSVFDAYIAGEAPAGYPSLAAQDTEERSAR